MSLQPYESLIGRFVCDVHAASEFEAQFRVLVSYVQELGFDHMAYVWHPIHLKGAEPIFKISDGYPLHWLAHYQENNLARYDFTLRMASQRRVQYADWWLEVEKGNLSEEEKSLLELAREPRFGVSNGISFAAVANNVEVAGGAVITAKTGDEFEAIRYDTADIIQLLIQTFHNLSSQSAEFRKVMFGSLFPTISEREWQVLDMRCEGRTFEYIADELELSVHYCRRVFRDARMSFKARDVGELMHFMGLYRLRDLR